MKKYLLIIISLLLSLSLFISCDNGSKAPSSTTEEKPTTTSEIVILDFSDVSNSRGLTKFPDTGNPFGTVYGYDQTKEDGLTNMADDTTYGLWMSCNVMRSLPILPGLKSANASANAYVNSIKNKDLEGYGFPIKVVEAKTTSDGVYIVYDVLENGKVNGRIEYYYSTVEKKFSYREIVAPLFGIKGGDQIFVFEMFNVPVEKTKDGYSFKAGKLYNNGSEFRHVSFIYDTLSAFWSSGKQNPLAIDRFNVEDSQLVMNYSGKKVTSMEYKKYITDISNNDNQYRGGKILLTTLTGDVNYPKIDISNRLNALQLDAQVDFLKKIFNERSFAFGGYNSLSDFNGSSLEYLAGKQELLKNYTTYDDKEYNGIGFPLSYDLENNIGACLYNSNGTVLETHFDSNAGRAYSFTPFVLKQFKNCFDSEDITSFDQFVSLMFKNLGLNKYVEDPVSRKELLKDSYNNN